MADIRELVDIDKGRITGLVFTEAGVYQQALKNAWARPWIFLAHDSMLPKAGSYMQTYIEEDAVGLAATESVKTHKVDRRGDEIWLHPGVSAEDPS